MASGNMLKGLSRNRYDAGRSSPAGRAAAAGFVNIVLVTAASKVVTVTFDQPVCVSRTPAWAIDGQLPSASRLTSPTTLLLTYPEAVAPDELMYVTYQPGTVCGVTGGAVPPQQFVPSRESSQLSLAPAEPSQAEPSKLAA